MQVIMCFFF